MRDDKYLNAPIEILGGFLDDPDKVLLDIRNYAIFKCSLEKKGNTHDENYRQTANYFKMEYTQDDISSGRDLYEKYSIGKVTFGLKTDIYIDFYGKNEKNDFDYLCLLAFLAMKSIIGTDSYKKSSILFTLSRMAGKAKACEDLSDLPDNIAYWENRYRFNKLKTELQDNWGLKYYSYKNRGFYISYTIELKKLVLEAETRSKKYKEKYRNELTKNAREEALKILYGRTP